MSRTRTFRILALEAARDGMRRRFAIVVALVMLVGLLGAETCTDFGFGEFSINDHPLDPRLIAGFVAPFLYAFQVLTLLVMAGVLAADHLARSLAEGSASLWLARPVGRSIWAGARLAGALGVSFAAGAVLLGGTGSLLVLRHDLAVGPALEGALAGALGSLVVAALAMTASLALGRTAVVLLVALGVPLVALANAVVFTAALVSPELEIGGITGAITQHGPPLGLAILAAVAPWNPHIEIGNDHVLLLELAIWGAGSVALLLLAFRRIEIR